MPSHEYQYAGSYTVTQTVLAEGGEDTATAGVVVSPAQATVPTLRSTPATNAVNSGGTITATLPTGILSGDLLLMFISQRAGNPTLTGTTGWTFVGKQSSTTEENSIHVYRRSATASNTAPVITSDSTAALVTWVAAWQGGSISTSNPLNVLPVGWYAASSTSTTVPTITTTSPNTIKYVFISKLFGGTTPTFSASNTWTDGGTRSTTLGSNNIATFTQYKLFPSAGVTNTQTITTDTSTAWAGLTFAINAPGGNPPQQQPTGAYQFEAFGIHGGGFQNVIQISPFLNSNGKRPYISGADVAGNLYSVDQGKTWTPSGTKYGSHVASVAWSPTIPGKAFALSNEGFYVSTDFGVTFTKKGGNTNADGNGSYTPSGWEHPRPTGNLIAVADSGSTKHLWVGCATQGIKYSQNDGQTYIDTALAGDHIRSIAVDPNNPDRVWVAIKNTGDSRSGMWQSTNATSGSMTFTKMTNYPGQQNWPEEMYALDDNGTTRLYVAGFTDGIFRYVPSTNTWTALNSGVDTGNNGTGMWESIFAYKDGANIVVLAGCAKPINKREILRSTNGGSSWSVITTGSNVSVVYDLYGTNEQWWADGLGYHTFANGTHVASGLAVDPDRLDVVMMAGRGGIWAGQLSGGNWTWKPAVKGMMVTVNNSVDSDPNNPNKIAVGNMDYVCLYSTDYGQTAKRGKVTGSTGSTGDQVFFDRHTATGNSQLYIGSSKRGQNTGVGNVDMNPNIGTTTTWTRVDPPGTGDCTAVGTLLDGTTRVILAVRQSGSAHLYRKYGNNAWVEITGGPFTGSGNNSAFGKFETKRGSSVVFAHNNSGTWRNNNAGAQGNWVRISTMGGMGYDSQETIIWDNQNPDYLYIVSGANLHRITNAQTAGSGGANATQIFGSGATIGPIGQDTSGRLFVHDRANGVRLMMCANPRASSPTFTDVSDQFYRNTAGNIRSLHVASNGYIYTAENGSGVMVGKPTGV